MYYILNSDLRHRLVRWVIFKLRTRNLFKRQKSLTFCPIIDESSFQTGFHFGDDTGVNVSFAFIANRRLNIQVK